MATRVAGKVTRLYVRSNVTYIRLEIPVDPQPLENYFTLELANPNYNALYSLALSAVVNGYPLLIRVSSGDITPMGRQSLNIW